MKKLRNWIAAYLIILASSTGCTSKDKAVAPANISATEAMGLMRNDFAVLLDLRTVEDATKDPLNGVRNVPATLIEKELGALPKDKQVVLISNDADQSTAAGKTLSEHGFKTSIVTLDEWKKANAQ